MSKPLDPERSFEQLKEGVIKAIKTEYFPDGEFKGKRQTLRLKDISVHDNLDFYDLAAQQDLKEKDGTWAVPIKAQFELVDNTTGKVIDTKTTTIAELPKLTPRFSYIVDGKERQVDHQSLLKQGIYTRIADNGAVESRFNTKTPDQRQNMFKVNFDPESHQYQLSIGATKAPLVPVMKALGVSDEAIQKAWGAEIYEHNKSDDLGSLKRVYKALYNKEPESGPAMLEGIKAKFNSLSLDPNVTEMVVGNKHDKVTGDSFLDATKALLDVTRGVKKPSGYDDLRFKQAVHTEDYIPDRLRESKRSIVAKLTNNLDRADKIDRIIQKSTFDKPITNFFSSSSLSMLGDQTNPLGMITGHTKHTILGEHGISSPHQVTLDAKIIHPSSYGFLDPSHTPECYTPDTEVFTLSGWKRWDEVTLDDQFACRINGRLEFHPAEKIVHERYAGPMCMMTSPRIEYCVTPNHRLFVRPKYGTVWRIQSASEAHGKKLRYTSSHDPLIGVEDYFELPLPSVVTNKTKLAPPIPLDDWLVFLGWYISEGSYIYDTEKSQYHVRVHQKKEEYLQEIREMLDRLPFLWCENTDGSFAIATRQSAEYVHQFGKAQNKYLPDYAFTAPISARENLLDALLKGDGRLCSTRTTGVEYNQKVYTTTSPELAKDVERLAIGLGYAVTSHKYQDNREERYLDVYEVRLLKYREWVVDPDRERSSATYSTIDYDGYVYCATVPGGLLYVRKGSNGKVGHWSGNSDRTGISLQIPLGTWKEGNDLVTEAVNARTGKLEKVTATQLAGSNLAFPDEYRLKPGKIPVAIEKEVVVADKMGETRRVPAKEVDYILPSPAGMFSATTNLIPFLQNNNGNRVGYGTQQAHQALALVHREEPLVQSATGASTIGGDDTFEGVVGVLAGHRARVEGAVTKITDQYIFVKTLSGATVKHSLYKDYPLNNKKGVVNSSPLVKVGDTIKKGQTLADNSFTRNGKLALGTNLDVAYVPADGYNFEDGIVISESAAQKLTSEHMYKKEVQQHQNMHLGTKKFKAHYPTMFTKDQLELVDDNGVIKPGTKVKPGDPLILAVTKNTVTSEAEGLARVSKGLVKDWKDSSLTWEGDTEGVVTKIIQHGNKIKVHVKTEEPMQVGDKLVGRHGNKGICTKVLPDSEMPQFVDQVTGQKKALQVMLNPMGVPGRINPGQLLETSAALIAKKTGQTYKVRNFDPDVNDYTEKVEKDLAKHGLKATTTIIDPKTGKSMGDVHLGGQFMMKLDQQVTKKMSARGAGYGEPYDANMAPTTGGGRLGALGNYAMLAHGAINNLREMQTYKSSFNDEVWRSIQTGDALPAPRTPYSYEKFTGLLKGMGVNTRKEGSQIIMEPLTDKNVEELSNGEVKDAGRMIYGKDLKAEREGLFDPKVFGKDEGGLRGTKWGHITLAEPMPNPVFEKAILTLTGLTGTKFENVLAGKDKLDGLTGPAAIKSALDNINVTDRLAKLEATIANAPASKVDSMNKEIRYLRNLKRMDISPSEAYLRQKVPVLPPIMRPLSVMDDGSLNTDDLNALYRGVGLVNKKIKELDPDLRQLPEESGKLYASLYDGMKALTGVGTLPTFHQAKRDKLRSIMGKIEGKSVEGKGSPKTGFFQETVMSRKQDMSMRSTIIPNQSINIDEVALPRAGALQMFKPHLIRELRNTGLTTLQAHEAIKNNDRSVDTALEHVMKDTPILLKRDPVLHKFGVMAFKPTIAQGNAIEIHPLVTGGFNADFDGDSVLGKIFIDTSDVNWYGSPDKETNMPHKNRIIASKIIDIADFPRIEDSMTITEKGNVKYAVPTGIRVPAVDNTGVWDMHEVSHFSIHPNCEEWITRTLCRREFITSQDHSLAVLDPDTLEIRKATPREAQGLAVPIMRSLTNQDGMGGWHTDSKDFLYTDREDINHMAEHIKETFDTGWFLGAYLGDGWTAQKDMKVHLSFGEGGRDVADRWASLSEEFVPGAHPTYTVMPHKFEDKEYTSHRVNIGSAQLSRWILSLGVNKCSFEKALPIDFLQRSEQFRRGLFCGLMDTDGTINVDKNKRLNTSYTTKSRDLAAGIHLLALSLGIHGSITEYEHRETNTYVVSFSNKPVVDADWIQLTSEHKQNALVNYRLSNDTDFGRNDVVPLPEWVRNEIIQNLKLIGATKKKKEDQHKQARSLYMTLQRKQPYLTRSSVKTLLELTTEDGILGDIDERMQRWLTLVTDRRIGWDIITETFATGETKTMYDLTVPGPWTFTMENGAAVWDTMAAFAPIGKEAIEEARRMLPSNNLFNPTSGSVMYAPGHEAQTGIYRLSQLGKETKHKFANEAEASAAMQKGTVAYNDQIVVGGKRTTMGRIMLDKALPKELQGKVINSTAPLDKKFMSELLTEAARKAPKDYPDMIQQFKDLGNTTATQTGLTLTLSDIKSNQALKDQVFAPYQAQEQRIRASKTMTLAEKEAKIADIYRESIVKYDQSLKEDLRKRHSSLIDMADSGGVSGSKWNALKQLAGAPIMFEDAKGKPVPVPVLRSYSQGLRLSDFMTAAHGARMGTLSKSQGTSEPGALSKNIVNSTMNQLIAAEDCATNKGILMDVTNRDVVDRYVASDIKLGRNKTIPAGTLITPEIRDRMRGNGVTKVHVRSSLKCAHGDGICQKCAGLSDNGMPWDVGTNIGIISAQAMGEPTTQISMNAFHCCHKDSLVCISLKNDAFEEYMMTMEDFFETARAYQNGEGYSVSEDGEEIVEIIPGWYDWVVKDNGEYVSVTHVRRHAPTDEMVFVSTGKAASICQANHPLMGRSKTVKCVSCGYHRLKRRDEGGATYCAKCGTKQEWQEPEWSEEREFYAGELELYRDGIDVNINNKWQCKGGYGDAEEVPGYIAGFYIAEGSINYRPSQKGAEPKPYSVVFSQYHGDIRREIYSQLAEYLNKKDRGQPGESDKEILIHSIYEGRLFEGLFGRYSHNKKLPTDFIEYEDEWLTDFLCGYIDGNGCMVTGKGDCTRIACETTSFALAQQLLMVCRKLDMPATIQQTTNRLLTRHQGFRILISPSQEQYRTTLGNSIKAKGAQYGRTTEFTPEYIETLPITSVKPSMYEGLVYDLTTETGRLSVSYMHHHNTGGVIAPGDKTVKGNSFQTLKDLLNMPEIIKGSAKLSPISGRISGIRKDPAGGFRITVTGAGQTRDFWSPNLLPGYAEGKMIKAGDAVSNGPVNPRELLPLAGLDAVKGSLTNQIHDNYGGAIKRRHVETVVKAMTDLAQVKDAGDDKTLLPGDLTSASLINQHNSQLGKNANPVKFQPILKGLEQLPTSMQEDWAARMNYRYLKNTVIEGALQGWKTDLHGRHPVPGLMYGAEFGKSNIPGRPY